MASKKSVIVAIRVDSGSQMGSGHLMRCLSLAGELTRSGARVTFICRELPGHLCRYLEREGHTVVRLREPEREISSDAEPSGWLQVPEHEDGEETAEALRRVGARVLVVDHYGIGSEWERLQRPWVERIVVIDDQADRKHCCDVLVDPNYFGKQTNHRYDGLVPANCRMLLGPRYALLQREYRYFHSAMIPRTEAPRRVLIFFGGSDSTDETSKALRALSTTGLAHLAVDVVLGPNYPSPANVTELVARRPGTTLHTNLPSLAGLMFRADLAIGAGGVTTSERLCMGLPSIVITVAANQEGPVASLSEDCAVIWAGSSSTVSVYHLAGIIEAFLRTPSSPPDWVDGRGASRVAAMIIPPLHEQLVLRRATVADARLIFEWRNEPTAREMSFDSAEIHWEAHLRWFESKLRDNDVLLFIGDIDDLPVAQVRIEFRNSEAHLSYGVDADFRGLCIGASLVERVVKFVGRMPVGGYVARVKIANEGSRKIFNRLGWRETIHGSELEFRLERAKSHTEAGVIAPVVGKSVPVK